MNRNRCIKCGSPKKKHVRKNDNKYHCTVKGCKCVVNRDAFFVSHDPYIPKSRAELPIPIFPSIPRTSRSLSENVSLYENESDVPRE